MAEISPPKMCEKNAGSIVPRGHCWHALWAPSGFGQGQFSSREQQCCWCGEVTPLAAGYNAPILHGPHEPPQLPQAQTAVTHVFFPPK